MPCFTISNFLFLTMETAQFIVVTTVADSPWIPFPHGYLVPMDTQEPLLEYIQILTFGHSRDKITFRLGGVPGLLGVTLPLSYNGTQSSGDSPLRTTALKGPKFGADIIT